ncbi:hypothetical protein CHS0354_029966, partial [Potamilus streckersoni]
MLSLALWLMSRAAQLIILAIHHSSISSSHQIHHHLPALSTRSPKVLNDYDNELASN